MANPEARLQIVVVNALRLALPPDAVLWATLAERHVSPETGAYLNRMGRVAGLPDLMVLYRGRLIGIELKTETSKIHGTKRTNQTKAQKAAQKALEAAGGHYAVCRTLNEVLDFLGALQVPLRARAA